MPSTRIGNATILSGGDYEVGSQPPEGNNWNDWAEWARIQHNAGLRQRECAKCGCWKYPQELSDQTAEHTAKTRRGKDVRVTGPVCTKCAALLPNAALRRAAGKPK
jgi:hypothetical protein